MIILSKFYIIGALLIRKCDSIFCNKFFNEFYTRKIIKAEIKVIFFTL